MAEVRLERLEGGAIWRATMDGGKGNVLDAALADALSGMLAAAAREKPLKAIVLEGAGPHFSFGASVQEHLPGAVAGMLTRFHALVLSLVDTAVPVLAAVRGRCLGGGLELATVCQRVFASPDARLGQPEILLGVFAPVASIALPERVGRRHAEDLCTSGRTVTATEALAMGLVDEIADGDPAEAALVWAREHLLPRSASSLRFAVKAVRGALRARLAAELPAMERLYLEDLMSTHDAVEGLEAFLQKRPPVWKDA